MTSGGTLIDPLLTKLTDTDLTIDGTQRFARGKSLVYRSHDYRQ